MIGLGFGSLALVGDALHGWDISSSTTAFTAQLIQLEQTTGDSNAVLQLAHQRLAALGIEKVTLQLETVNPPQNPAAVTS